MYIEDFTLNTMKKTYFKKLHSRLRKQINSSTLFQSKIIKIAKSLPVQQIQQSVVQWDH